MYEMHGWIVLRESPAEVDLGGLAAILDSLRIAVGDLANGNPSLALIEPNGMPTLVVTALFNHAGDSRVAQLRDLVLDICRFAPGSYGVLHVWDTDDLETQNEMKVVSVRRGEIHVEPDYLLSPCVPMIEDEEPRDCH
jgi:hypothetical protein